MEPETKADWIDIERQYYNALAEDYAVNAEDSFVYRYYAEQKDLQPDKIDRAFKDFLYNAGLRLTKNDDLLNAGIYVENLNDRVVTYGKNKGKEDRTITGRKEFKTDRTLAFISEICKRNWFFPLDGVSHLDNPAFKDKVARLFEHLCREYKGKAPRIDLVLAADPRTGVTLHLMGIDYLKDLFPGHPKFFKAITSSVALAISTRVISEDGLGYNFCDYDEEELYIFGVTQEFKNAPDIYRKAAATFKTEMGLALDQLRDDVSTKKLTDEMESEADLQEFVKLALSFE